MILEEGSAPEYYYKLRVLLDALKYIPTEALNAAFDSPPDMIMIHGNRYEKIEPGRPFIYYDANGVKPEGGWLQHLEITPMYGDRDGGTHGVSSDIVHLFYSEPDLHESLETGPAPSSDSMPAFSDDEVADSGAALDCHALKG